MREENSLVGGGCGGQKPDRCGRDGERGGHGGKARSFVSAGQRQIERRGAAAAPVGITLRSHEAEEGYGKDDGAKQAPLSFQQLRYAAMMICK